MTNATLTISSKNYSSWSLRGWLMCRLAGLDFEEEQIDIDDVDSRQELLLLSSSFLVPRLTMGDVKIWATLAIGEHLNEQFPEAGLLPADPVARAHCRAISGEMHAGFYNLRSALPMNIRARYSSFPVFSGARPDIQRILKIWTDCLETYGGPFLFGPPSMADAMYAPACTRFRTYGVKLPPALDDYCDILLAWGPMAEGVKAAEVEPERISEFEVEF